MDNQFTQTLFHEKMRLSGLDLNRFGMKINDPRFYDKVIEKGSLGLGESYMEGWWDVNRLDEFIHDLLNANLESSSKLTLRQMLYLSKYYLINPQTKNRSLIVGKKHYDIGNDLFMKMLDKRMAYSCAYWKDASCLDEAQEAKLELICQKLCLKPGMKILDIGCGWGSFAKYAAEKYGAMVDGITISHQQLELAQLLCKGLPISLRFQDYRDVDGMYDRIVSIGQIEHVGAKNYRNFMQKVHCSLKSDGIFLLHTIGSNKTEKAPDPWIEKYIFPNGLIPSAEQLTQASNGLFIFEDWHNFGADYDKTLMAWHRNFVQNWDSLKANYGDHFYRMWTYYLLLCAAAFRSRSLQLWQVVFVKNGIVGGYSSIR